MKYFIDRIIENKVILEDEFFQKKEIDISLIPNDSKEGNVLSLENGVFVKSIHEKEIKKSLYDLQNDIIFRNKK